MYKEDVLLAKKAVNDAVKLVDARMQMIERIDKHPLSWPVAAEFQKLKRAKTGDAEDEKLFAAAEKKVKEAKMAKSAENRPKWNPKQRVALASRPTAPRNGEVKKGSQTQTIML